MTMNEAIRTWLGINRLSSETNRLEKTRTNVVASPIPMPLMPEVVTASVGHSPRTNRKGGMVCHSPLVKLICDRH